MTAPRITVDFGATLPGPGPEGRYSPIKVNVGVQLDVDETFDAQFIAALAAIEQVADPLHGALAAQAADLTGIKADDGFRIFRADLKIWQDTVVAEVRRQKEVLADLTPKKAKKGE